MKFSSIVFVVLWMSTALHAMTREEAEAHIQAFAKQRTETLQVQRKQEMEAGLGQHTQKREPNSRLSSKRNEPGDRVLDALRQLERRRIANCHAILQGNAECISGDSTCHTMPICI